MGIKVLFIQFLSEGHLQLPISIAKNILFRDIENEVYFITDRNFESSIKDSCSKFKTLVFDIKKKSFSRSNSSIIGSLSNWLLENKERFKSGTVDFDEMINYWKPLENVIPSLIDQVKPDLIFIENSINLPFVMKMGYKWVQIVSTNPLKISDQISYPPNGSGVHNDFKWYSDTFEQLSHSFRMRLDDWYKEYGLVRKPSLSFVQPSEYFNVFLYPRPLNYFDPQDLDGKWMQLNSPIVSDEVENFIKQYSTKTIDPGLSLLTPEFLNRPKDEKLIFFSMGNIVSEKIELMKMYMSLLANCRHKFILSKGNFGDLFDLPSNCVGANRVNQEEILKSGLIDLCVFHGGNNSFTTICYYGIRMIIIPTLDQHHDNACRLETFGLCRRVFLSQIKTDLIPAIEFVLNDEAVKRKMQEISTQMKEDKCMEKLIDKIYETCCK